jgi:AhpD family alkylhydroperoxidase
LTIHFDGTGEGIIMAKHDFSLHTLETAPEASRKGLAEVKQKFGRVPNFFAAAAESPAAVNAYVSLSNIFRTTGLTPAEQQIVILAASVENKCDYCVAAHSKGAKMAGVPEDAINAIKARGPLEDAKTEALRRLVSQIVDKRGWLSDADVQAFLTQGYSKSQLYPRLLQIAVAGRDGRGVHENTEQLHQPPDRSSN